MNYNLSELQAAADAAEARAATLTDNLATLTDQAAALRTQIKAYTIDSDMLQMAADQNRLGFLDRQIAKDTPVATQAAQQAQDARAACEKVAFEVRELEQRLSVLVACEENWVVYEIPIYTWREEIKRAMIQLRIRGVEPQITSVPARPPLPAEAESTTM